MGFLSFLNSSALFFAAATILPLLIFLLARKKPRRIIFSSLRFIKVTVQQQQKKMNFRNLLLLLIRMLIILFAVIGLARPALQLRQLQSSQAHPPTAIAVILDISASMDYLDGSGSRLEHAKSMLNKLNALLDKDDISVLITTDPGWNLLNSTLHYGKIPHSLYQKLNYSWQTVKWEALVSLAEERLKESKLQEREIYIITDQPAITEMLPKQHHITVLSARQDMKWENVTCKQARIETSLVQQDMQKQIRFEAVNHGKQARQDLLCRLVMDNKTISEKFISIGGGQQLSVTFPIDVEQGGWHSGYIEIQDEKFLPDNRSYFTFLSNPTPSIFVISDESSLPLPLRTILTVYVGNGSRIQVQTEKNMTVEQALEADIFLVYNRKELTPHLRELLQARNIASKGVLFCIWKDMGGEWKSWLNGEFSLNVGTYQTSPSILSFSNAQNPVSSLLEVDKAKPIAFQGYYETSIAGKGTVLLASSKNVFAVANQNKYAWLFDVAYLKNAFFVDSSYPVFAFRTLQSISNQYFQSTSLPVGTVLKASSIILPDAKELETKQTPFTCNAPGVYGLRNHNEKDEYVAINQSGEESLNLTGKRVKQSNVTYPGKNWEKSLLRSRYGVPLWNIFLTLALVLLVVEMLLVRLYQSKSYTQLGE